MHLDINNILISLRYYCVHFPQYPKQKMQTLSAQISSTVVFWVESWEKLNQWTHHFSSVQTHSNVILLHSFSSCLYGTTLKAVSRKSVKKTSGSPSCELIKLNVVLLCTSDSISAPVTFCRCVCQHVHAECSHGNVLILVYIQVQVCIIAAAEHKTHESTVG